MSQPRHDYALFDCSAAALPSQVLSSPAGASAAAASADSSQPMLMSPAQAPAAAVAKVKKEKEAPNSEPLTLDEERQLRVSDSTPGRSAGSAIDHRAAESDENLTLVVAALCASPSVHILQLHYSIQLTQMATILNLPPHVTVGRRRQQRPGRRIASSPAARVRC